MGKKGSFPFASFREGGLGLGGGICLLTIYETDLVGFRTSRIQICSVPLFELYIVYFGVYT